LLEDAEEGIYNDAENPRSNWTPATLRTELESANWNITRWQIKEFRTPTLIRSAQIEQWFETPENSPHSSYGQRLSANLSSEELIYLRNIFRNEVAGKVVEWRSVSLFMELCNKTVHEA
jgi:hypothetical protein